MSQRQKTQAELEQEARDEEFAKLLQEELNMPPPQPQQPPAQQYPIHAGPPQGQAQRPPVQQAPRVRQVFCPVCNATNHLPGNAGPNQQFKCGSCSQFLPPAGSAYEDGFSFNTGIGNAAYQRAPASHQHQIAAPPGHSMVTCQNCRSLNTVPIGATTQFMCGTCHRVLGFNQGPGAAGAPPPAVSPRPAPAGQQSPQQQPVPAPGAGGPILQGTVTRTVQVRCGQCSTVNAVKQPPNGSTKLEFLCGSCRATNEVSLA
jgi:hypothetical protein